MTEAVHDLRRDEIVVKGFPEQSVGPFADRRTQLRLPLRGAATLKVGRRTVRAETVDISTDGVCLTLPFALDVGSSCPVELHIEGQSERSISVMGRVCFCLQSKDRYRVGLNCSLAGLVEAPTK